MNAQALVLSSLLVACGGDTLHIGSDRISPADAGQDPCTAPPGPSLPAGRSIAEKLPAAVALLPGRWFVCPNTARGANIPAAVELTADTGFALVDAGDGTYGRPNAGVPLNPRWSLRNDALLIDFPAAGTIVLFEDSPLRMTWNSETLFTKR